MTNVWKCTGTAAKRSLRLPPEMTIRVISSGTFCDMSRTGPAVLKREK